MEEKIVFINSNLIDELPNVYNLQIIDNIK